MMTSSFFHSKFLRTVLIPLHTFGTNTHSSTSALMIFASFLRTSFNFASYCNHMKASGLASSRSVSSFDASITGLGVAPNPPANGAW